MRNSKRSLFFFPSIVASTVLLSACSGGSGSSPEADNCLSSGACTHAASTQVDESTVKSGIIVDAPVQGLNFKLYNPDGSEFSGDIDVEGEGVTDENGRFSFYSGLLVEFSIGNIQLGRVAASELVSTRAFRGDSPNYANNVARLLQSLDSTPEDKSVITLDQNSLQSLILDSSGMYGVDFDVSSVVFGSQLAVSALVNNFGLGSLVSAEDAEAHVDVSLQGLSMNPDFQVDLNGTVWKSVAFSNDCGNEDIGMYGTYTFSADSWEWRGADYADGCRRDASNVDTVEAGISYDHEYSICSASSCSLTELNGRTEWFDEDEAFYKRLASSHVKGSYVINVQEEIQFKFTDFIERDELVKMYLVQDGDTKYGLNFKNTTWHVERFKPSLCGDVSASFVMEFDEAGISRITGEDLTDSCGTRQMEDGAYSFKDRPWSVGCFAEGEIGFCDFAELNSAYGHDGEVLDGNVDPYTHLAYEPRGVTGDWGQIHWRESNKKAIWTRID